MGEETVMRTILDAGPLIAALSERDEHHAWAASILPTLPRPFVSCPEAMAEAAALTGRPDLIVEMILSGEIDLEFDLQQQAADVSKLLRKYPQMDLADACIVRLSELIPDCQVATVDKGDFSYYRRHGRHVIPTVTPP